MFGNWIKKESAQLKDIMEKGKICTLHDLKYKKDSLIIDEWRYSQLKHFVTALPQTFRSEENMWPLERLCIATDMKKGVSKIYKILMGLKGLEMPPFIGKWRDELGSPGQDLDVGKILKLAHTTATDSTTI